MAENEIHLSYIARFKDFASAQIAKLNRVADNARSKSTPARVRMREGLPPIANPAASFQKLLNARFSKGGAR